jgi:DNA polymerase delta subunit 1
LLDKYVKRNGYEFDCKVIYVEKASVTVKFGTNNIDEAMRLGKEAADYVSGNFNESISLKF